MTVFFLIAVAYVIINDIIPLANEKRWGYFILCIFLMFATTVLFIIRLAGINLPSPVGPIEKATRFIYGDLVTMFEG